MNVGILLAGLASGVASGMGIGGGAILIPALTLFFGVGQQNAQSANLAYFIPAALFALFVHIKNKDVDFKIASFFIGFGLAGAVLGAWLAARLDAGLLRKAFAAFLIIVGAHEIFRKDA
jgi:uncharacterized membrane protein YfcA